MIAYIDATYLVEKFDPQCLELLHQKLKQGKVPAGICVYLHDIDFVKKSLAGYPLRFITVINFPHGTDPQEKMRQQIEEAINLGVDELDIVIPNSQFFTNHDVKIVEHFIRNCVDCIQNRAKLKIILETGLHSFDDIYALTLIACEQGADFIKTSTGKVGQGATLEATKIILKALQYYYQKTQKKVGLKVSGGIRTLNQAQEFIDQMAQLGQDWLTPDYFRIGASQLISEC